jgi:hypothetical protein
MNRSWTRFRRAALALSFAGAMGFGATQALAAPDQAGFRGCKWGPSGPLIDPLCDEQCRGYGYDYGSCRTGTCVCHMLEGPA